MSRYRPLAADAPAVRRTTCRRCGAEVDSFTTDYGRPVRLDTTRPPITTDLAAPANRYRVWEDLGPRLGWTHRPLPQRSWRDQRLEHECAPHQLHQHQKENQND